jgi:acetyl-CoA synthetase
MSIVHPVIPAARERARVNQAQYETLYRESIENNESFWGMQARRLDWFQPFSQVRDVSWARDDLHIRWYQDGTLNACYNCVDRHLDKRGDQAAIIWEGDEPGSDASLTYRELHQRVCRMANVLKGLGAVLVGACNLIRAEGPRIIAVIEADVVLDRDLAAGGRVDRPAPGVWPAHRGGASIG